MLSPQFRALNCVEVLVKRGVRRKNRPSSIDRDAVFSEIALTSWIYCGVIRWGMNDVTCCPLYTTCIIYLMYVSDRITSACRGEYKIFNTEVFPALPSAPIYTTA